MKGKKFRELMSVVVGLSSLNCVGEKYRAALITNTDVFGSPDPVSNLALKYSHAGFTQLLAYFTNCHSIVALLYSLL